MSYDRRISPEVHIVGTRTNGGGGHRLAETIRHGGNHGVEAVEQRIESRRVAGVDGGRRCTELGGNGLRCLCIGVGDGHRVTAPDEIPHGGGTYDTGAENEGSSGHQRAPHDRLKSSGQPTGV